MKSQKNSLINIADINYNLLSDLPIINSPPYTVFPEFTQSKNCNANCLSMEVILNCGQKNLPHAKKIFRDNTHPVLRNGDFPTSTFNYYFDGETYSLEYGAKLDADFLQIMGNFASNSTKVNIFLGQNFLDKKAKITHLKNPISSRYDRPLVMYTLARRSGLIIHSAGIEINGKGYIISGRSGAGKTTISRLLQKNPKITIFSDDRMIARKIYDQFFSYGTPWPGDAKIARNLKAPLKGIFFISHAKTNNIRKIAPFEALQRLFIVASIPWFDKAILPDVLTFCEKLVTEVPIYELQFSPDAKIASFMEEISMQDL